MTPLKTEILGSNFCADSEIELAQIGAAKVRRFKNACKSKQSAQRCADLFCGSAQIGADAELFGQLQALMAFDASPVPRTADGSNQKTKYTIAAQVYNRNRIAPLMPPAVEHAPHTPNPVSRIGRTSPADPAKCKPSHRSL